MQTISISQLATNESEILERVLESALKTAPQEFKMETGRIFLTIKSAKKPLTTNELLVEFYKNYNVSSILRQKALYSSLSKLLQRARSKLRKFGLSLRYCYLNKTWSVKFVERRLSPRASDQTEGLA